MYQDTTNNKQQTIINNNIGGKNMLLEDVYKNKDLILFAKTGSHAYGTNIDSSDLDYKGIFIPTLDSYFGLKEQGEYNNASGKTTKNTSKDIDINLIPIDKFVSRAMKGSSTDLELLFMGIDNYEILTEHGKRLVDNRHLFISKAVRHRFLGYASKKTKEIEKSKQADGSYDTKNFMHVVRLLTTVTEILETGEFSTRRPNSKYLLECRNGEYTFEQAIEIIERLENEVSIAYENSKIPERVDEDKINKLLIEIVKSMRL